MVLPARPHSVDVSSPAIEVAASDVATSRVTTDEPLRRLALFADSRRRAGAPLVADRLVGQGLRLGAFVVLGVLVVSLAPGTGSIAHLTSWWARPIVYQKFAMWALLWELLGLGGGSVLLRARVRVPVAVTHWLRVDTVRLPPWPGKVLATTGTRRTRADVALYVVTVLLIAALVFAPTHAGQLPAALVWTAIAALGLLGLRDKVPFLAARPDVYLPLLLVAAFPPDNTLFAAKLCLAGWLWGRAFASLNRAFPSIVALGAGDAPWRRVFRGLPGAMWRGPASAPVPSPLARSVAAALPALQTVLPLVLLVTHDGTAFTLALVLLVALQLVSMSSLPADAALETDAFLVFSTLALFGAHAGTRADSLYDTVLAVLLAVLLAGRVLLGAVAPRLVSPLMSLRFHCGTEAVSLWLVRRDLDDPLGGEDPDRHLAARALLPHTGALLGLLGRAVDDPGRYRVRHGDLVAADQLGWAYGDGRLAGTALLDDLRSRVELAPGQVRLVTLAAHSPGRRLHYRITDAATGKLEQGTIAAADVLDHRPFDAGSPALPCHVTFHVLPPPAPIRTGPRPTPRPENEDQRQLGEHVRLGADGVTGRHRPRPSRPAPTDGGE